MTTVRLPSPPAVSRTVPPAPLPFNGFKVAQTVVSAEAAAPKTRTRIEAQAVANAHRYQDIVNCLLSGNSQQIPCHRCPHLSSSSTLARMMTDCSLLSTHGNAVTVDFG
jgi:hypothetical protein